jgi:hypothetical protein
MPLLSTKNEFAFRDDLPWLQADVARRVSDDVPDQSVEKQHLGTGVKATARYGLSRRLAVQAQSHEGNGRTRGGTDLAVRWSWMMPTSMDKAGWGWANNVAFVAAILLIAEGYPQVARLDPVTVFTKEAIAHWASRYPGPSTRVISNELNYFPGVDQAGAVHAPEVIGAGRHSTDMP